MTIGTRDFVDQTVETFTGLKQPFVLVVLDGPNYSFRFGSRGPQDLEVLAKVTKEVVLPSIEGTEIS